MPDARARTARWTSLSRHEGTSTLLRLQRIVFACAVGGSAIGVGLLPVACGGEPSAQDPTRGDAPSPHDAEHQPMSEPRTHRLTPEIVASLPAPGLDGPAGTRFAKVEPALYWLGTSPGTRERKLMSVSPIDGTTTVVFPPEALVRAATNGDAASAMDGATSRAEELRRERARDTSLGVTSYAIAAEGTRWLVPWSGGLWTRDHAEDEWRALVPAGSGEILDPRMTRDGRRVAFVRDGELHVLDAADGEVTPVTAGARAAGVTHGLAEYVAQEEMDRAEGYWWSPSGSRLAFTEVDERHVTRWHLVHQANDVVDESVDEVHAYPFAGTSNAHVRLAVIDVAGSAAARRAALPKPRWLDLELPEHTKTSDGRADLYLARVHFVSDDVLLAQIESRDQRRLDVVRYDVTTGRGEVLWTESREPWINLHSHFRTLDGATGELAGGYLWASERSGFMHLELRRADGSLLRELTSGPWQVDGVVALDVAGARVWFTATKDHPTQKHLYVVGFDGGEPRRLTPEGGMHEVVVDVEGKRFVDAWSSRTTPPRLELRDLETGALTSTLWKTSDTRVADLPLPPPRLVELTAEDGTPLHAALYEPAANELAPATPAGAPRPLVVSVYGGPHAQRVQDSWGLTADLRAQALRERGYVVMRLDNRGSARRGLAFEGVVHRNLGDLEVQDQVTGVRWLAEQGLVDPTRVGIYGWSYGGYMSAMAMVRAPDVFAAAVAGAPVTHWDGYDTHYTERYMGTPQDNAEGYARSSVMHHAAALKGRLLLVHGLVDENVHVRHTIRLLDALMLAGHLPELLLLPRERHLPRRAPIRAQLEARVLAFFDEALAPDHAHPSAPSAPSAASRP